ncbi:MAG: hypothetical protein IJT35_06595 [Paludibacteraceae bacterium]|nr:hypothetical protein [Paludibacteraceae bacterium]
MKKHFILVLTALFGLIGQNPIRADYPTGAVRGVFTVARGTQVVFSRGNLQYTASTNEWRFATNQYDIIGEANKSIGKNTYGGAIDLFGWGTGGTPTKTACSDCSTTFPIVGNDPENKGTWDSNRRRAAMEDGYNDFIDWGNNAITNGGNVSGQWRTLTADEWDYVIRLRDKAAMLFSLGKVAGVNGFILLPDEWTLPDNLTFVDAQSVGMDISQEGYFTNINESNFELNDYTVAQWQSMQNNGAVFLPAAGSRAETLCNNIGQYGYYWSSTADEAASAFSLSFTESIVAPRVTEPRASGQAVRLVADYSEGEEPTVEDAEVNTNMTYHPFTINADGGQISFSQGNLQYQAAPNKVFRFAGKQTDYIGEDNNKLKTDYTGWIDLMAYPTGNLNYRDYGPAFACAACVETGGEMSGDDDFDSPTRRNSPMSDDIPFTEFGDNTILNAGNYTWRTLTANEWGYLFLNRKDAADLFGFATVDNVRGVVILPDDWSLPSGSTFVPASEKMNIADGDVYELKEGESAYTLNIYSSTDMSWQKMEAAGAVFLPAAGYRKERVTAEWNESGFYLSSTEVPEKSSDILLLNFKQTTCQPNYSTTNWENGYAVRLVRPYSPTVPETHTLTIEVSDANGGYVKDADGNYVEGTSISNLMAGTTLDFTVEVEDGYTFTGWTVTETTSTLSSTTAETTTFTMGTADVTLKANFTVEPVAHVHNWSEPTYTWNADNTQCTATRFCLDDASHIETETVDATMTTEVTKEATCEEDGEETDTYTAIFENEAFGTQTKQIKRPIIALGHKSPVYTWSADYTTCTAVRECEHVAAHNISETVNATVTTVGGSLKIYTAVFTNQLFEEQEKTCVTMSEYGFLSLYADKAYIPTGGLTTIIYTGMEGRNLITQSLTLIPAYTGVFFIGEANKTYELVETITDVTYPENMLHGTLSDQPIPDNGQVHYILSRLESTNKGGLYWPANTNRGVGTFTNHAGKAYLEIPVSSGVAPRYFTMRGEACEEITAVGETQADGDGKYYDVLGREVREPQPQHIYIHNGQKVLYGE